jgi:hypothetical protein
MKNLFKRFNIEVDLISAQRIFINKINNYILFFPKFANDSAFAYALCNNLGIEYMAGTDIRSYLPSEKESFKEYILYLQIIINMLFNESLLNKDKEYVYLLSKVQSAIEETPIDLGIKLKKYKSKAAQIRLSGSKLLDEKLVDDVLGLLSDSKRKPIRIAFEKGLNEYLESISKPEKLKNTFRDMQLSCDETCKLLLKNKQLGFAHLFKKNNWEELGLNSYQKQIFWVLNEYIDKFAKHKSDAVITREDTEFVIYLTGMFIRLLLSKNKKG